jgi:hypothetical protein
MIEVKVLAFSEFPGPRNAKIGSNSGEEFRDTVLIKQIELNGIENIVVNLDGTAGYGSSFLEEAFGGLIRKGYSYELVRSLCDRMISNDDPSLIDEIRGYVEEEGSKRKG